MFQTQSTFISITTQLFRLGVGMTFLFIVSPEDGSDSRFRIRLHRRDPQSCSEIPVFWPSTNPFSGFDVTRRGRMNLGTKQNWGSWILLSSVEWKTIFAYDGMSSGHRRSSIVALWEHLLRIKSLRPQTVQNNFRWGLSTKVRCFNAKCSFGPFTERTTMERLPLQLRSQLSKRNMECQLSIMWQPVLFFKPCFSSNTRRKVNFFPLLYSNRVSPQHLPRGNSSVAVWEFE